MEVLRSFNPCDESRRDDLHGGDSRLGEDEGESPNHSPFERPDQRALRLGASVSDTSPNAFIFPNNDGGFIDTGNDRKRVLHKLARDLKLPKLTFQIIRRSIATLAQNKGTVKDVQGVLRHSSTATTTDVYMQEIPEGVRATIDSIHRELRKGAKLGSTEAKKSAAHRSVRKKTGFRDGESAVLGGQRLRERRSASSFKTPFAERF